MLENFIRAALREAAEACQFPVLRTLRISDTQPKAQAEGETYPWKKPD